MCCLALCGGAWACSISGVYRGLNCFLRDSGYFCKRCLIKGIAAEPSNLKLCRVRRHWRETGYFPHPPCTAGSPSPPSWSPLCWYPAGAVPCAGLRPSRCRPPPPAMLSLCLACGSGGLACVRRWRMWPDGVGSAAAVGPRAARWRFAAAPAAFVHFAHARESLGKWGRAAAHNPCFWGFPIKLLLLANSASDFY